MTLIPDNQINNAADRLRALAHPLRLAVLCHLSNGPMTVSDLVTTTGVSQSSLSQHLAKLRMMGILNCERQGQHIHYRLADPEYSRLIEIIRQVFCDSSTETEARL